MARYNFDSGMSDNHNLLMHDMLWRTRGDCLKTEVINQLIKAYEENDLEKCETQLT